MTQYNEFPNFNQRIATLSRRIRDQETAPRLYSAGIGAGGIRIYGGGSLDIRNGGDLNVLSGGDIFVGDGGSVRILNSGQIISEGAANFTGSAKLKGNTSIAGSLSIQGDVTFPAGKLEGAFLKNQFYTTYEKHSGDYSGNFTGERTLISRTVSVPSWAETMYTMLSGVASINNANQGGISRGHIVRVFADTAESPGGLLSIYSPTGTGTKAEGIINSIKEVNVSSKTSVRVGLNVYQPATGGTITTSFYATIIFVR